MSLISSSEMAALRGVAESGMISTCSIYYRTVTQTDNGSVSGYPDAADATSICWLTEFTPDSALIAAMDGAAALGEMFRLRLPTGTTINSGDKVVIAGLNYFVQHEDRDSTYLPWLTIVVRRVI